MKINFTNNTIELTKAEAKKAGVINSNEYNELNGIRKQYPTYTVKVIERKPSSSSTFKGMNCAFMENYIKNHDTNGEIMAECVTLRNEHIPYGAIRKWFFEKYPQFKSFTTKTQWVLAA